MILGIGIDLCMIPRIGDMIEKYGERFLNRVFTEDERIYCERFSSVPRIGSYAKRWAAKEACVKALGTGVAKGITLQDISVFNDAAGAPKIALRGKALAALEELTPTNSRAEILVSLTDDTPFAMAQVIIQAIYV
ncbi:holo-ACP synthase [Swingsia samuiensis]|uniref:Holo-[acyl-carrier-protein] synthase n=1 Tax=Swingsia samuiensis TaxID=1293412 RepID=A0A4Y6ULJ1_9PROT|nr:holo-ACP synthase [Swingsia samuiensis]QDH17518.1 holo-ACP synthase [Swingsia samuiensis]